MITQSATGMLKHVEFTLGLVLRTLFSASFATSTTGEISPGSQVQIDILLANAYFHLIDTLHRVLGTLSAHLQQLCIMLAYFLVFLPLFCLQPNLSLSCHAVSPLHSCCRPFSFFFFLSGEFIVIFASNKYILKISFCDEVIQIAHLGNFNSTNAMQSISEFLSYDLHLSNPHSSTPRSSH